MAAAGDAAGNATGASSEVLATGPKGLRYEIGHGNFSPYVQPLRPVRETFS
ncbi:hypothetical protein [Streptomyces sp. AC550_RSS872]|uniref:hypothetical protein n=1 Tax=Streptomyces sp. AC550_RSS872 TaxID=2823689 RepID=UPI001C26E795|nr:hypothetical protein [Streptomyces sp. AC550_RSS872]